MISIFEKIGLRKIINAHGPTTRLGGSVLASEVVEAMAEASQAFVYMDELQEKAGKFIAEATGAEAAYITAGASAGLSLSTAACIAGSDPDKAWQLPNTEGLRDEVIFFSTHRYWYERAFRLAGARIKEIEHQQLVSDRKNMEILEKGITEMTAAVAYVGYLGLGNGPPLEDVVNVAHSKDVPVILDASATLPPLNKIRRVVFSGADLIAFSGGKAIMGPNNSGFVLGRKDLIETFDTHYWRGIGRSMKVSKETIMGLVVAFDLFMKKDHEAELRAREGKVNYIVERIADLPHVEATHAFPDFMGRTIPCVLVDIDEKMLGITIEDVVESLKSGDPSICIRLIKEKLWISSLPILEGQERIIAERLRKVLTLSEETL